MATMAEVVRGIIGARPVLLSDVVAELRFRGWKVRGHRVAHEAAVLDAGFYVARTTHGAGAAVYVAAAAFSEVTDGRGRVHQVRCFHRVGQFGVAYAAAAEGTVA